MWVQVSRRVQAALALCFGWGNMSGFKLLVSVGTAPTEARTGGIIGSFYKTVHIPVFIAFIWFFVEKKGLGFRGLGFTSPNLIFNDGYLYSKP